MLFEQLKDKYLRAHVLEDETRRAYTMKVRQFLKAQEGEQDVHIEEMTDETFANIREFYRDKWEKTTLAGFERHANALLNWAVEMGWIPSNPLKKLKKFKTPKKTPESIDAFKLRKILRYLDTHEREESPKYRPHWFSKHLIRAFFYTGLRRRQLAELEFRDIMFQEELIRVRAETEKNHTEHFVPIHPDVLPIFRDLHAKAILINDANSLRMDLMQHQVFHRQFYLREYVPLDKKGHPVRFTVRAITEFFQELQVDLSMKISAHKFRHGIAKALIDQSDIKTVQEFLGHQSIQSTEVYVTSDVSRARRALEKIKPEA